MAYIRGPHYLWRDDNRVHLRAEDGYAGWHDTDWAEGWYHSGAPGSPPYGEANVKWRPQRASYPLPYAEL